MGFHEVKGFVHQKKQSSEEMGLSPHMEKTHAGCISSRWSVHRLYQQLKAKYEVEQPSNNKWLMKWTWQRFFVFER